MVLYVGRQGLIWCSRFADHSKAKLTLDDQGRLAPKKASLIERDAIMQDQHTFQVEPTLRELMRILEAALASLCHFTQPSV